MVAFVMPLILTALLWGSKAAHANTDPAPAQLAPDEEFEAGGAGDFEEGECEEAEFEFEEGEIAEAEFERACEEEADDKDGKRATGTDLAAPEECLLRSANARLVAYDSHNDVRLTVGYTTYEPVAATIDYRLADDKGSLHLGTAKRHLGRSGVIRLSKALADPKMDKVEAAGLAIVRLHIAGSPSSCRRFETEQLNVKRASKSQAVWSESR
jgi:hypothetical protein